MNISIIEVYLQEIWPFDWIGDVSIKLKIEYAIINKS